MNYDKYFETLEKQCECSYKKYGEALKVFNYLNEPISSDFYHALAIATDSRNFKIIHEDEVGWEVIIANAVFAFGDNGKAKIKENK